MAYRDRYKLGDNRYYKSLINRLLELSQDQFAMKAIQDSLSNVWKDNKFADFAEDLITYYGDRATNQESRDDLKSLLFMLQTGDVVPLHFNPKIDECKYGAKCSRANPVHIAYSHRKQETHWTLPILEKINEIDEIDDKDRQSQKRQRTYNNAGRIKKSSKKKRLYRGTRKLSYRGTMKRLYRKKKNKH